MPAKRRCDDDAGDDPPVAATQRGGVLRRAVVSPKRAEHFWPPAAEQSVVDNHFDRRVDVQRRFCDQPGQHQPDLVGVPHVVGKEPARGVKRHRGSGSRSGEHADHGAAPGLGDQPGSQQREHRERRRAPEHGAKHIQHSTPRSGQGQRTKHRREPRIHERIHQNADASS
jgi:hypothetical protein